MHSDLQATCFRVDDTYRDDTNANIGIQCCARKIHDDQKRLISERMCALLFDDSTRTKCDGQKLQGLLCISICFEDGNSWCLLFQVPVSRLLTLFSV